MALRDHIRAKTQRAWGASFAKAASRYAPAAEAAPETIPALLDFIPAISPELVAPYHLTPVIDAFGPIAVGEIIELAFSVPPRHFKTTTLLHGIAWLMLHRPGFRVAYLTFSEDRALTVSRDMQRIALRADLKPGTRWTNAEWETSTGCVFRAASLLAGVTGAGFDLVVVDDPYRRRADAESVGIRRRTTESWAGDVYTRQETRGTSYIVLHTRWHPADLIGTIIDPDYRDGRPFAFVNLPAIDDDGSLLLPEFYDADRLSLIRSTVGEYEWASQYQGEPRPRGGAVFEDATYTEDIPTQGRYSIGVDLAYTSKTSADYSVAVVVCRHGDPRRPTYTIVDMVRRQCSAPDFVLSLKSLQTQYPGATMRWYAAGTEKGAADFIKMAGVNLDVRAPVGDKFVRAQPLAAAWAEGRVLIPRSASWAAPLIDEVCSFTGVGDTHDDIVDALAAGFDAAATGAVMTEIHTVPNRARRAVRGLKRVY